MHQFGQWVVALDDGAGPLVNIMTRETLVEYDPTAEAKIREKVEQCQAYVDKHWIELGRVELDEF